MFLWDGRLVRYLRATYWTISGPRGAFHPLSVFTHWAYLSRRERPPTARETETGDYRLEPCSCRTVPDIVRVNREFMIRCPNCRYTGGSVGPLEHVVSLWNAK